MNLQLSLKKKWFEMTKAGIKTEDYREITPYWCNRFLLQNGKKQNIEWWIKYLHFYTRGTLKKSINEKCEIHRISFIDFDVNIITLGCPKSTDTERILKLEHKGVEIRIGNPEWGAEPNKLYFVIKHGEIIN